MCNKSVSPYYLLVLIQMLLWKSQGQVMQTDLSGVEIKISSLNRQLADLLDYVHKVKPTENCEDLRHQKITKSGLYHMHINGKFIQVYCDFDEEREEDSWLTIQRRISSKVDFYRNWVNYVDGFGNLTGNFWLGLESIHMITNANNSLSYTLRVDMMDFDGRQTFAEYKDFSVASADENYRLSVGEHSGTAVDSLEYHNGMPFSTMDMDNDHWSGNCAQENLGAWWYNSCYRANLNGKYFGGGHRTFQGIVWFSIGGLPETKRKVEMKIKPIRPT